MEMVKSKNGGKGDATHLVLEDHSFVDGPIKHASVPLL